MDECLDPVPAGCRALPFAEQLVLWALRLSVLGIKTGAPLGHPVAAAFRKAGAEGAAERIDLLTRIVGFGAERRVQIAVPCAATVTEDERMILALVGVGQSSRKVVGTLMLRGMLRPAACRAAAGLAVELGDILAAAGLHLQPARTQPPAGFLELRAAS